MTISERDCQCAQCAHLDESGEYWACPAFPEPGTIPDAILGGEHDHRKPYEGDRGVRFKARPGAVHPRDLPHLA